MIRNAPTDLMKELNYGQGYEYAHDTREKLSMIQCLPDSLADREYYVPTEEGQEETVKKRLDEIKEWRRNHAKEFDF